MAASNWTSLLDNISSAFVLHHDSKQSYLSPSSKFNITWHSWALAELKTDCNTLPFSGLLFRKLSFVCGVRSVNSNRPIHTVLFRGNTKQHLQGWAYAAYTHGTTKQESNTQISFILFEKLQFPLLFPSQLLDFSQLRIERQKLKIFLADLVNK